MATDVSFMNGKNGQNRDKIWTVTYKIHATPHYKNNSPFKIQQPPKNEPLIKDVLAQQLEIYNIEYRFSTKKTHYFRFTS